MHKDAVQFAGQIFNLLGGRDNILTATHCMTRLRVKVRDASAVKTDELQTLSFVLGLIVAETDLQIILGPGIVNKVAAAFEALLTQSLSNATALQNELKAKNRTPFKLFLRRLANIFVPLIPAIVGSGMVAGITNVAVRLGADQSSTAIVLLNTVGWGIFAYLAVFVGINAAKEFGGTPALGGLAGVLLINPAIASIKINGTALVPGRGGIIGVLLVACFMAWLEKRIRRFVPEALDIIVTPTLTLLIGACVAYFALQPLGGVLSDAIVFFFSALLANGGPLAGFALAGTFLPIVMTGLHQGLVPIHMEFLNTLKENPLLPILAMGGAGQVGATLAVYCKTRNRRLKNIIKAALPVGFLGIGEPLIFGVTLPLGRPFITACIGAACGGAYQAAMHTASIALGVSGLPLAFLIKADSIVHYLIGLVLAYGAGFAVTWLAGFEDPQETLLADDNRKEETAC